MTADARARLRRGIEAFGLVDPIIARRSDRLVVGGHQRLAVAMELGLPAVPVIFLDNLSDHQAAALNVLLNNPEAQGAWDLPKLSTLLSELDGEGFDATLTGFDATELERLLTWTPGGHADDATAEPAWAVVVTCRSELEQTQLLERFLAEGLSCRALLR